MNIHTDIVYRFIGYDVIIYFWSEVTAKKNYRKYSLWRVQVEFLENSLSMDHQILNTYQGHSAL